MPTGRVTNKIYYFAPSTSPDVVGYMLYWEDHVEGEANTFQYSDSKHDIKMPATRANLATGETEYFIDLASIQGFRDLDARINLSVTAYDEAGNESGFGGLIEGALIDFQPPEAPGAGGISDD